MPQFCFEHFMYDRLIRYYFDRFGRDSVLVLSFEQFQGDSTAFLDRITRFCGASVERLPDAARRSNPGRAPCLVQLRRRLNYFLRRDELNGQSHMRVPHLDYYFTKFSPILEGCTPAFLNRRAGDKIRQVIEREVEGMFGESNRATAKLTGLDLEAAGYDMT